MFELVSARSPVFSHLNASLQGLTTIRAFGAQAVLEKEFDKLQVSLLQMFIFPCHLFNLHFFILISCIEKIFLH